MPVRIRDGETQIVWYQAPFSASYITQNESEILITIFNEQEKKKKRELFVKPIKSVELCTYWLAYTCDCGINLLLMQVFVAA